MATITQTEFVDLITNATLRFDSNANLKVQKRKGFLLPLESDDEDQGLTMRLDNHLPQQTQKSVPVPAKLCGQGQTVADMALTSASLLQAVPEALIKPGTKLNKLFKKLADKVLPFLLYSSLVLLGFQALAIIVLLVSSALPLGLWFLLSCGVALGSLYIHTTDLGFAQIATPPPTPSQSSASLSSLS